MSQQFLERMNGSFRGMLHWSDLDALWAGLRQHPEGWYISLIGTEPAQEPVSAAALESFIAEVDMLLRSEHECDYCGIVFADDSAHPTFIKIHDPHNIGGACSSGATRIPPRWVLSRMKPALIVDEAPLPGNRKRWWQKLFG